MHYNCNYDDVIIKERIYSIQYIYWVKSMLFCLHKDGIYCLSWGIADPVMDDCIGVEKYRDVGLFL